MNLEKLFKMQKELDERILDRFPELRNEDLLDKKILALQVELGELAQKWRGFKFWSENQESRTYGFDDDKDCEYCNGTGTVREHPSDTGYRCPDCEGSGFMHYNPLLEEYVDCLHFILSIGLEHEFNEILPLAIEPLSLVDTTHQLTELMRTDWEIYEEGDGGYFHEGLELFLGLGSTLGFTWQQIEQAYYDKNKVNHERQSNGY